MLTTFCRVADGVAVRVTTDADRVVEHLAEFYPPAGPPGDGEPAGPPGDGEVARWAFEAVVGPPPSSVPRTAFGVGFETDAAAGVVRLWSTDASHLAITTRKGVREVLLERCAARGFTMLHASAVHRDDAVVMFAADKRGGKTTLALRAVLEHGWDYLSNDHLIVHRDGDGDSDRGSDGDDGSGLVATSLPTPIPVKVGTYLDLEHRLPPPWDSGEVDLARFRAMAAVDRYRYDTAVYFTYARLGQPNPVTVPLQDRRLVIVLPSYAVGRAPQVVAPVDAQDAVCEVERQIREDWVSPASAFLLPSVGRDRPGYRADSRLLVGELVRRAAVVRWSHRGDVAPLLDALGLTGAGR